ncbi:hypothetical protein AB670_02952 [Chryseobacterium sp. MOF25P]|nr:hypothetical protein AB670_02952 [Chryseobacterium sp. MOF25P]OBW45518.1 hypothetical protein AB671_02291 [Chryseobacterium sp. BGARF1]
MAGLIYANISLEHVFVLLHNLVTLNVLNFMFRKVILEKIIVILAQIKNFN